MERIIQGVSARAAWPHDDTIGSASDEARLFAQQLLGITVVDSKSARDSAVEQEHRRWLADVSGNQTFAQRAIHEAQADPAA